MSVVLNTNGMWQYLGKEGHYAVRVRRLVQICCSWQVKKVI